MHKTGRAKLLTTKLLGLRKNNVFLERLLFLLKSMRAKQIEMMSQKQTTLGEKQSEKYTYH